MAASFSSNTLTSRSSQSTRRCPPPTALTEGIGASPDNETVSVPKSSGLPTSEEDATPCAESARAVEGIIVPIIGHGELAAAADGETVVEGEVSVVAAPRRPAIRSRIRCATDWIFPTTPEVPSFVCAFDAWPLCIIVQPVWAPLMPAMLPVCAWGVTAVAAVATVAEGVVALDAWALLCITPICPRIIIVPPLDIA